MWFGIVCHLPFRVTAETVWIWGNAVCFLSCTHYWLLCVCFRYGQLDVVRYLVTEAQCDPNIRNKDKETPIHTACLWVVLLLWSSGQRINCLLPSFLASTSITLWVKSPFLMVFSCKFLCCFPGVVTWIWWSTWWPRLTVIQIHRPITERLRSTLPAGQLRDGASCDTGKLSLPP